MSLRAALLALAVLASAAAAARAETTVLTIRPSAADPAVKAFDEPNVVMVPAGSTAATPLAVFLPGTGGKPVNARELEGVVAGQGYRVIGLEYDDDPAANVVCPRTQDPRCAEDFREMRIYGDGPSKLVSNPPAEGIEARLVALLRALDRQRPGEGWGGYLAGDKPDWSRMTVSGLSQGAGMAAFICKRSACGRVVLFSSPWDFHNPGRRLDAWLSAPSATPPDRWYASYHVKENTADLLKAAYAALAIPPDHVHPLSHDLPPQFPQAAKGPNPYHGMTIRDVRYAEDWKAMYGQAP